VEVEISQPVAEVEHRRCQLARIVLSQYLGCIYGYCIPSGHLPGSCRRRLNLYCRMIVFPGSSAKLLTLLSFVHSVDQPSQPVSVNLNFTKVNTL
jgi:hypothetical protein